MFENLSERLSDTMNRLRGSGRITEDNVADTLRSVRMALLEADVALPVVKAFIQRIRERAVGAEVIRSLTPGQAFIKVVHDELQTVLGRENVPLNLKVRPPAVILMAGLQGAGKTTTVAKLAHWLKQRQDKKVAVVSTDVYRPAAIEQLDKLAAEIGIEALHPGQPEPVSMAKEALQAASRQFADVLIVDTAGRVHVDQEMMDEISALHDALRPAETLFVVDCMAGQDAARAAGAFSEVLPLTGVVLTKTDGDARGGAALSVRHITGQPVKFMGVGEKITALEPFHPERIASRILGMGDILGLVEEAQQKVDREQAEKIAGKISKGKGFDLDDFRIQLEQMQQMGGLGAMLDKLPGMGKLPAGVQSQFNDAEMRRQIAIINSMTTKERRFPGIINGSRRRRIAQGSGTQVQQVNQLLRQFTQMQKMMKKMRKGGMARMLRGMGGRLPPGIAGF